MKPSDYFRHHQQLLNDLHQHCLQQPPFNQDEASDTDKQLLTALQQLCEADQKNADIEHLGRSVISRLIGHYPHITPAISRDLLWFFGGDCLHFMGDDELALYQQLDERLFDAAEQPVSYAQAKAEVFKLH